MMAPKKDNITPINDDNKSKLISLWETEPVLYDSGHREYHNNNKRIAAIQRIIVVFEEEVGIKLTDQDVRYYIKSLRTTFNREKRKVDVKKSGSGTNELRESQWRFFNELQFLSEYSKPNSNMISSMKLTPSPNPSEGNEDNDNINDYGDDEDIENDGGDMYVAEEEIGSSQLLDDVQNSQVHNKLANKGKGACKTKKQQLKEIDNVMGEARSVMKTIQKRQHNDILSNRIQAQSSPNALFGKLVESSLSEIEDKKLREMAKLEIQQVLFKYQFYEPLPPQAYSRPPQQPYSRPQPQPYSQPLPQPNLRPQLQQQSNVHYSQMVSPGDIQKYAMNTPSQTPQRDIDVTITPNSQIYSPASNLISVRQYMDPGIGEDRNDTDANIENSCCVSPPRKSFKEMATVARNNLTTPPTPREAGFISITDFQTHN